MKSSFYKYWGVTLMSIPLITYINLVETTSLVESLINYFVFDLGIMFYLKFFQED